MIRTFFTSSFFIAVFFALHVGSAKAALLYFDPGAVEISRGDSATISLRLDTDTDECVNTVDAVIHYDDAIKAIDVSRGDSILNLWVESPVIDEVNHTVAFAGGVPGGYCGRIPGDPSLTNVILKIVFRSPGLSIGGSNNDTAHVWLDEASQVLLHDGYGTPAPLKFQDANISLSDSPGTSMSDSWRSEVRSDIELPGDFVITLTKDDTAFSGRYFIVFNSSDKQSGIDHYEVMEEPFTEWNAFTWGRADAPWKKIESPYVLVDQTLNSTIRVKVIDKAGNERIATLVPDTALRSMSRATLLTVAVGVSALLIIGALAYYGLSRRRNRIIKEAENVEIKS